VSEAPSKKQDVANGPTDRPVGSEMLAEIAELSDAEVEILLGAKRQGAE
jgi:hypothetical protein